MAIVSEVRVTLNFVISEDSFTVVVVINLVVETLADLEETALAVSSLKAVENSPRVEIALTCPTEEHLRVARNAQEGIVVIPDLILALLPSVIQRCGNVVKTAGLNAIVCLVDECRVLSQNTLAGSDCLVVLTVVESSTCKIVV